ncbi:hypothetical protein CKAH01_11369 [Colletotrichum kahawae]|uniref:Uncharacterized protein n=1 Tax=Colletotrichum kahawae TaxID=34407 RepID=A0AAD9YTI5_COLKA|nr:hypothetical protein CKAH01_11369 [Colletotrichum kahawae]
MKPLSSSISREIHLQLQSLVLRGFLSSFWSQHGHISSSSTKPQGILSPGLSRPRKSLRRPCPRVDMTRGSTLAHPSTNHCPLFNFDRCSVAAGCTNTMN